MAWISKGYIHTVYSDHVVECSKCGQEWVPERLLYEEHSRSFTCPQCNLTAAPVYLPKPSARGYDAVVRDCWEKFHGVTGRFVIHQHMIVECLGCGHVWQTHGDNHRLMCSHCHRFGVPQYSDTPAPRPPYGYDRLGEYHGGGNNRPSHEILCTRCDKWVPFCARARIVHCPGCDMPITVRLVGDKRIRELLQ